MLTSTKRTPFTEKVCRTLEVHGMVTPGDSILLGVSGGPDSVALAIALVLLRKDLGITLGIAHINHLLRDKESDRDEAFVQELARSLELPFHPLKIDVATLARERQISLEETAREVRYAFFTDLCRHNGYTRTAVGHTLDDNAELVLMNLLRGSGPRGLAGIPPVRDHWIIRPLIGHTKGEILAFLREKAQAYVVDSTNLETVFLRNRIRNELLPLLRKEYNPRITENLNRVSRIMGEEDSWMDNEAGAVFKTIRLEKKGPGVSLCLDGFNGLLPALKRRIVRKAIQAVKGDLKRITLPHVDAVAALAAATSPGRSLDLPGRVRIFKQSQTLCFKKEPLPLREIGKAMKREKHSRNTKKVFLA
ncbi:tRNA(Ile)-lysidine synthetase-like protein [Desulforapulum autotrophicum HRM2]|uniref:tRNA(Ile)-lysidine synthase n=1 Tax=Desulforapulum autotrophicum (strain ATCC 43914 / DSM 3382 / VKM B-1955 / HRM2) TaxID=177437 RepID=C0QHR3_DESAH|nr:tRNA lysidine(34) synthetase TilS [Desulforapulum autotrophicum]ACN13621.1 tRNA(Ile)-lysidine synthetase-like protein [Desulforapulum autotrophicum HRM2]